MAEVELRRVTKRYGETIAVSDLSFIVQSGELLVLLGPPGAGKSSTLKMVAGVEDVTSGEILIDGEVVNYLDPADRDVAMAFETYALYPHLSVFENIAFPLRSPRRARLFSEDEVRRRVLEVARFLEIDMLLARKPKELSGGQRQRVSLARCLIREPKVFLLDEPIAHLDAKLRHKLRRELKIWQKAKSVTTLYTTTDYLEAFSLGDRIAVLNRGMLQQIGTWNEIYDCPANTFVGMVVSDPPMNYFDGQVHSRSGEIGMMVKDVFFLLSPSVRDKLQKASLGKDFILGVFPSKILLQGEEEAKDSLGTVVEGVAEFVELRGARKIVFVQVPKGLSFTLQLPLEASVRLGETLKCFFPADALHVFDKESRRNVLFL